MKTLSNYMIFCFLLFSNIICSQENSLILSLEEFYSDNVVLKDSKMQFLEKFGEPEVIRNEELLICDTFYIERGRKFSSKHISADLYLYPSKVLVYCNIEDTVRLVDIDFKIMKNAKIYFRDFILDSNFQMQSFIHKFNLAENEDYLNFPSIPYYESFKDVPIYCYLLSFYIDNLTGLSIDFGFNDDEGRTLRFISFPYNYNNGEVVPVKIDK